MNANIAVEKLLGKADNSIYKLVALAAKRAQEISAGKPILLETTKSDKPTTIALEEIAAGKVHLENREEHHKHQENLINSK